MVHQISKSKSGPQRHTFVRYPKGRVAPREWTGLFVMPFLQTRQAPECVTRLGLTQTSSPFDVQQFDVTCLHERPRPNQGRWEDGNGLAENPYASQGRHRGAPRGELW